MARVALIEAYPYEAVWGGDAVYLDGIRAFLTSRGHEVVSYVTDVSRGRSNPTVKLRTEATGNHRWRVRNSVPVGDSHFCALDPRFVGKALRRLPGGRARPDHQVDRAEARWVARELKESPTDLAILAFGACTFAEQVAANGVPVLALKGFFSDRKIRLGESIPTPNVGPELLQSLAHATRVGFNNHHDLKLYERLSRRRDGVLVGMGFPRRIQPAPAGAPTALFVGARTKPNVESLEWFLQHVWPRVRGAVSDAELRIAGSIGAAFAGRRFEAVTFPGFVESLDREYGRAHVAVAPLVLGSSGVKTKIAEALSFGRPVVTTSIGVDPGDPGQYGGAVIVADAPEPLGHAIVRLLSDVRFRNKRIGDAAEQFERHFAPEAAYREVVALLEPAPARQLGAAE